MDASFEAEIQQAIHKGLRDIEKEKVARQQVVREAEKALHTPLQLHSLRLEIAETNAAQSARVVSALEHHFKNLGKPHHEQYCAVCNTCHSCRRRILENIMHHD